MLNVYLQNKISGIHIMNTAVSGNNSQALRERFAKDVLSYTADKVFILIGTNDLAEHKQLSKETYQKNLQWMIVQLKKTIVLIMLSLSRHQQSMRQNKNIGITS